MVTENLHRAKQCTPGCVCVISHVFQILLEQGECINVLGSYIDSWSPKWWAAPQLSERKRRPREVGIAG